MSLVLIRVDERLLHGQVAVGWVPHLAVDHIWIADDALAGDAFAREVTASAAPPGTTVEIFAREEAGARLASGAPGKTLLLVRSLRRALELIREGAPFREVQIGGLHWREGSRRVLDYLHVTPEDLEDLRELAGRGIRLYARDVPGNPELNLTAALEDGRLEFDHLSPGRS